MSLSRIISTALTPSTAYYVISEFLGESSYHIDTEVHVFVLRSEVTLHYPIETEVKSDCVVSTAVDHKDVFTIALLIRRTDIIVSRGKQSPDFSPLHSRRLTMGGGRSAE